MQIVSRIFKKCRSEFTETRHFKRKIHYPSLVPSLPRKNNEFFAWTTWYRRVLGSTGAAGEVRGFSSLSKFLPRCLRTLLLAPNQAFCIRLCIPARIPDGFTEFTETITVYKDRFAPHNTPTVEHQLFHVCLSPVPVELKYVFWMYWCYYSIHNVLAVSSSCQWLCY